MVTVVPKLCLHRRRQKQASDGLAVTVELPCANVVSGGCGVRYISMGNWWLRGEERGGSEGGREGEGAERSGGFSNDSNRRFPNKWGWGCGLIGWG